MQFGLTTIVTFTILSTIYGIFSYGETVTFQLATCNKSLTEPLHAEDLDNYIRECKPRLARDIISILPTSFRSNFTFIRKSPSAFAACVDMRRMSPRIILFSSYSHLLIAMPWQPEISKNTNCNAFESMELKDGATRFTLEPHLLPPVFAVDQSHQVRLAPVLPCALCHGENGVPRYGNYPMWHTEDGSEAFGELHDNIVPGSDAAREFTDFISSIKKDGSYNLLLWPQPIDPRIGPILSPYSYLSKFMVEIPVVSPNSNLSSIIQWMNTDRIYNKFKKVKLFSPLKDLFAYASMNCSLNPGSKNLLHELSPLLPIFVQAGLVGTPEERQNQSVRVGTFYQDNSADSDSENVPGEFRINYIKFLNFIGMTSNDTMIDRYMTKKHASFNGYNSDDDLSVPDLGKKILFEDPRFNKLRLKDSPLTPDDAIYRLERPSWQGYSFNDSEKPFCKVLEKVLLEDINGSH